jgi:hypothetical protein
MLTMEAEKNRWTTDGVEEAVVEGGNKFTAVAAEVTPLGTNVAVVGAAQLQTAATTTP